VPRLIDGTTFFFHRTLFTSAAVPAALEKLFAKTLETAGALIRLDHQETDLKKLNREIDDQWSDAHDTRSLLPEPLVQRRLILTAIPRRSSTSAKLGKRNWSSQTPAQNNVASLRLMLLPFAVQSFRDRHVETLRYSFPESPQVPRTNQNWWIFTFLYGQFRDSPFVG